MESKESRGGIVNLLLNICSYVVTDNVMLRDGEIVAGTADRRLSIIGSKGIAVDGKRLKIEF